MVLIHRWEKNNVVRFYSIQDQQAYRLADLLGMIHPFSLFVPKKTSAWVFNKHKSAQWKWNAYLRRGMALCTRHGERDGSEKFHMLNNFWEGSCWYTRPNTHKVFPVSSHGLKESGVLFCCPWPERYLISCASAVTIILFYFIELLL